MHAKEIALRRRHNMLADTNSYSLKTHIHSTNKHTIKHKTTSTTILRQQNIRIYALILLSILVGRAAASTATRNVPRWRTISQAAESAARHNASKQNIHRHKKPTKQNNTRTQRPQKCISHVGCGQCSLREPLAPVR